MPASANTLMTCGDELAFTANVVSPGKPLIKTVALARSCSALKQNRGASGCKASEAAAADSKVKFVVALSMLGRFAKEVCFDDSCYTIMTAIISPKRAT